jgi:hypothetical protein
MDYTSDPTPNQHPNRHDYDEVETIYKHLDSTNTTGAIAPRGNGFDLDAPSEWGRLMHTTRAAARKLSNEISATDIESSPS